MPIRRTVIAIAAVIQVVAWCPRVFDFRDFHPEFIAQNAIGLAMFIAGLLAFGIVFVEYPRGLKLRGVVWFNIAALAVLLSSVGYLLVVDAEAWEGVGMMMVSGMGFVVVGPPILNCILIPMLHQPRAGAICAACSYDLRGSLDRPACPECGAAIR